jgi:hypothetical protein
MGSLRLLKQPNYLPLRQITTTIHNMMLLRPLRFALYTFVWLFYNHLGAQNIRNIEFPELSIGEWRQHLPWQRAVALTQSEENIYVGTEWAVVELDKTDRSANYLTKVEGLSDAGLGLIGFNQAANRLLIAYTNSNMDIYNPATGEIINLPFIFKNTTLSGSKAIYSIDFSGEDAYLGTAFGLVKMDMMSGDVRFTTLTDEVGVYGFAVYRDNYYMATDEGLYRLPVSDPVPADLGRWELLGADDGLPPGASVRSLEVFRDELYAGVRTAGLFRIDANGLGTLFNAQPDLDVAFMTKEGAGLVVGWLKNGIGKVMYLDNSLDFYDVHVPCDVTRPLWAIEEGDGKFWFADRFDQFRFFDRSVGSCDKFVLNSPYTHESSQIALRGNEVFVASLGADQGLNPVTSQNGLYHRGADGQWRRINGDSNPETREGDGHFGWWRVAPHPATDQVFIGSFWRGLLEFDGNFDSGKVYLESNSILGNAGQAGTNRTAIGAMAFDKDNNLWINNYGASKPIVVLKPDGTLRNFSAPAQLFTDVVVDNNGFKWFVNAFTGGVTVYDSGAK